MDQNSWKNLNQTFEDFHGIIGKLQTSVLLPEKEQQDFVSSTPTTQETFLFPQDLSPIEVKQEPGNQEESRLSGQNSTYYTAIDLTPLPASHSRNNYLQICFVNDDSLNSTADSRKSSSVSDDVPCQSVSVDCKVRTLPDTNKIRLDVVKSCKVREDGGSKSDSCIKPVCGAIGNNVTYESRQTLSFDINNNEDTADDSKLSLSKASLSDSDIEANFELERAERRIAVMEEINYLLDPHNWTLEIPKLPNPALLAGTLIDTDPESQDNGPEFEPEERDAINWLRHRRDEFGLYETIMKEM